jgi:hypothetical protein
MNKEKLNELLKEKQEKIDELVARSQASENIDELKAINTQLEGLKQEISDFANLRMMLFNKKHVPKAKLPF